jgi:hypothetical protein
MSTTAAGSSQNNDQIQMQDWDKEAKEDDATVEEELIRV